MNIREFDYRPYRRSFLAPLQTAHGTWTVREGFIVRVVTSGGRTGYGEVAPLPSFGTESLESAESFLRGLRADPARAVGELPPDHPCGAFALSAAVRQIEGTIPPEKSYPVAGLLPAGAAALQHLPDLAAAGYRTFKWKIGVGPVEDECAMFGQLVALLPQGGKVRLDANAGLDEAGLDAWLEALRPYSASVDFIEQPMRAGREVEMRRAGERSGIAIALDESLNGRRGSDWLAPGAWDGPLVIKPALMGDCRKLVEHLRAVAPQVVVSSVFETVVGMANVLSVLDDCELVNRAVGMDTLRYFNDGLNPLAAGPELGSGLFSGAILSDVWKELPHLS